MDTKDTQEAVILVNTVEDNGIKYSQRDYLKAEVGSQASANYWKAEHQDVSYPS